MPVSPDDALTGIVAALHRATFDETRWREVSALIDRAIGMFGNHLMAVGDDPKAPPFFSETYARGESVEEIEHEYLDTYYAVDERVPRLAHLPHGKLHHNVDLLTEYERRTSPVYNDFLPRVSTNNQLCAHLPGADGLHIVFAVTHVDDRPWSSAQTELLTGILPHLAHFIRVRQMLARVDVPNGPVVGLLDDANLGVVFLDRKGVVIEANAPASRLLRDGNALLVDEGMLRAKLPADDMALGRLTRGVLSWEQAEVSGGSLTIRRVPSGAPLSVRTHVVPPGIGAGKASAAVLITEAQSKDLVNNRRLMDEFGLTRAEAEVASAIASGRTVRETAASTHRAEGTVRWHVQRIFDKTGVSRQADLVRLVLDGRR